MLAHAIGRRRAVVEALIPYLETIAAREPGSPDGGPMHVDGAYSWFRRTHPQFRTLVATPQIVMQRASHSDISGASWSRLPGMTALRRLKDKLS